MTAPYTAAELAAISANIRGIEDQYARTIITRLVAELTRAREALRDGLALANACAPTDNDHDYEEMIEAVRRKIRDALGEKQ